jgi:hypothetical protein
VLADAGAELEGKSGADIEGTAEAGAAGGCCGTKASDEASERRVCCAS